MSAIGAGAGEATQTSSSANSSVKKFRPPTKEEEAKILEFLNDFSNSDKLFETFEIDENLKELDKFLDEHPDVDVNQVYNNDTTEMLYNENGGIFYSSTRSFHYLDGMNLYGMLMLSPTVDISNPVLQKIIKRKPNPKVISHFKSWYNKQTNQARRTLEDFLKGYIRNEKSILGIKNENDNENENNYEQLDDKKKQLHEKILDIYERKLKYVQNIEKVAQPGRNLSGIMKSGLELKYPENVVGKIGSFLTGKKGFASSQMNQLKQNVGLASLKPTTQDNKKGGEKTGGKRKSKNKKSYKRKSVTRKGKKSRRL